MTTSVRCARPSDREASTAAKATALAMLLALAAACSAPSDDAEQPAPATAAPATDEASETPTVPSPTPSPTPSPAPSPSPGADELVEARIAAMSDEQLAGQLLLLSVYGGDAGEVSAAHAAANQALYGVDTPAEVVELLEPGGIILIGRNPQDVDRPRAGTGNVADPRQVPTFVAGLQAASPTPLLVAIDQEHGPVARLAPPFTRFPSAMALGAVDHPDVARRVAAAAARELAAAGITVNLAPVADVNTEPANPVIGLRSFGEDAGRSSDLVAAQVVGIQRDGGVAATAKHFPGHGDTTLDSHDALPTVDATLDELRTAALQPFRRAVDAGVELVMPGHLLLPAIDPDNPATLSPTLLRDVLRGELGFDGVVVSDSMWMGAIRGGNDSATAVRALAAGIDMLLMTPAPEQTRDAIVAAMASGELPRADVEAAVARVLRLKHRLGVLDEAAAPSLPGAALLASNDDLAVEVAARSITLLVGSCPAPLSPGSEVTVTGDDAAALTGLLGEAGVATTADAPVTIRIWDGRGTAPSAGTDEVVVVTGSPYAAGRVAGTGPVLLTYGDTTTALRGLAAALTTGRFTASSPVTITRTTGDVLPRGTGTTCP